MKELASKILFISEMQAFCCCLRWSYSHCIPLLSTIGELHVTHSFFVELIRPLCPTRKFPGWVMSSSQLEGHLFKGRDGAHFVFGLVLDCEKTWWFYLLDLNRMSNNIYFSVTTVGNRKKRKCWQKWILSLWGNMLWDPRMTLVSHVCTDLVSSNMENSEFPGLTSSTIGGLHLSM